MRGRRGELGDGAGRAARPGRAQERLATRRAPRAGGPDGGAAAAERRRSGRRRGAGRQLRGAAPGAARRVHSWRGPATHSPLPQGGAMVDLTAKPFHLDDTAVGWVRSTIDSLTLEEKIGQL